MPCEHGGRKMPALLIFFKGFWEPGIFKGKIPDFYNVYALPHSPAGHWQVICLRCTVWEVEIPEGLLNWRVT